MLRRARSNGLSAVAITDHETIEGAKRAAALNSDPGLTVIVGEEVRTDAGDIVGLFLERGIRSRKALEVAREIKEQGGLVLLPHPFGYGVRNYDEALLEQVDLIEIRNGRTHGERLGEVLEIARRHRMVVVGNSDAHFVADIGRTRNYVHRSPVDGADLRGLLSSGKFSVASAKCPDRRVPLSQLIKSIKQRRARRVAFHAWWYLKSVLKDGLQGVFGASRRWSARSGGGGA